MTIQCGCITHPGLTHEEHMDRFDRKQNEAQIKRAQELLKGATSYGEAAHARALLRDGIEAEIRRLTEKERLIKLGRIRGDSAVAHALHSEGK